MRKEFMVCFSFFIIFVILSAESITAENISLPVSVYDAYKFSMGENWNVSGLGDIGDSRIDGTKLVLDFTKGTEWISITVPEILSLPGTPQNIRLTAAGSAKGHPIQLYLKTHWMTFYKNIGEFSGHSMQTLVIQAPPGEGWKWYGGENDGQLHLPLRVTEIRFSANGIRNTCNLELSKIQIEAVCPENKRCMVFTSVIDTLREKGLLDFTGTVPAVGEKKEDNASGIRFSPGQKNCFLYTARGLSEKSLKGKLTCLIKNWDGENLDRIEWDLNLPANAVPVEIRVPISSALQKDYDFIEAEFTLDIPGQEIPISTACYCNPKTRDVAAVPDEKSPFGLGVYLAQYFNNNKDYTNMEYAAKKAVSIGASWIREDFLWEKIEPEKGKYEWEYYDRLVDCAKDNGINIIALAAYWTPWTKPYTTEGVDDYLNYLRETVKRYHGYIKYWEIWNEPNIFFWEGPKDLYFDLLTKSCRVIKEIDPDAKILGLSLSYMDWFNPDDFIRDSLKKNIPYDIITIHPYREYLDEKDYIGDIDRVSDLIKYPDGKKRPVWITEIGWTTIDVHNTIPGFFRPVAQREQAELISRTFITSIASGADSKIVWYNFRDNGVDPYDLEQMMGIAKRDFYPKPAMIAYNTMTKYLGDKDFEKSLEISEGICAYSFTGRKDKNKTTIVLWAKEYNREASVRVGKKNIVVVNTIGEKQNIPVINGMVNLKLKKDSPVYIDMF